MADNKETLSIIHDLVETCRDGETGYLHAAHHISDPDIQAHFEKQSIERRRFLVQLKELAQGLGETETDTSGSTAALLHRMWFGVKADLGMSDAALLSSVESGEERAAEEYRKALESPLPEDVRAVISEQAECVFNAHQRILRLLASKAA